MTDYVVPLYRAIASSLEAMQNCVKDGNKYWRTKHKRQARTVNGRVRFPALAFPSLEYLNVETNNRH